ncbi:unnamed protein product [Ectocarpus sp. CCAP 1310/34]|nr:unnamed protein product [Ectocarpus sp. CCAP 1310/34]
MKEFNNKPPVPGVKLIGYVDDLQAHLPPGLARNMQAISTVTNWIQERLSQKGIELSLPKSKVLFPEGLCMSSLTNDEQQQLTKIGLSVAEGGMPVVGIPVGTEEFQRNFVSKIARGDPAELILRLATLDDPQASYQLLRLSGVPRLFQLLRTIAPSITNSAAKIHDNMMMWAMSKIVLGKMADSMRIPTVKEVRADPTKSEEVDFFKGTARAQVHLPMREGGLGITSNVLIRESAFVAGQALVFSKSVQASTGYTVEQCLPRLAQLPTGLALIDSLKKLEEIITKDKLEKAVGQSWAKLATSDELTPALKGVYLLEAGKAGKPREDGNPDVEHQPPSTFSRNEFGQHYQVFGAQALLSKPLHAAVRHMVETDLQKVVGEETPKKRALIRLEEAKGKGVLSWLTTQGLSADERMLPDLYRESIGRVLGSHDRADCNTGKLCGAGALLPCKDRLSRAHSLVCTKTGASTFLHNRMVRVVLKTLRECHMPIAVEDSSPFTTGTGRGKGLYKMDLVIPPGLHAGEKEEDLCTKSILIDVTIVNPSAGRSIDKSILKPGSALEDRAASKANHYAGTFNPSRSTLLTAAFSTNGGLGKGTNRLIVAIANHLAHEAFCRENFDDERALVRLKAFHTNRIRRRFTFELARFLSMRTRDVFKRHGLLIDQLPPGPIGWDLCDNDSSEGNSFGSDEDEGKGKGRKEDDDDGAEKHGGVEESKGSLAANDLGINDPCYCHQWWSAVELVESPLPDGFGRVVREDGTLAYRYPKSLESPGKIGTHPLLQDYMDKGRKTKKNSGKKAVTREEADKRPKNFEMCFSNRDATHFSFSRIRCHVFQLNHELGFNRGPREARLRHVSISLEEDVLQGQ